MPAPETIHPNRREVLALAAGAFVVAAVPAVAWARRRSRLVARTLPVMGTLAELVVVADDRDLAERALDAAFAELVAVDRSMSRFRDESDVGRANLGAAAGPVAVGEQTAFVLARALDWAEWTDGAFDPCLGRAVRLWDVTRRRAPPADEAIAALADRALWTRLELGASGAVRFADGDVSIDLGGIAKGHAVDLAAEALRSHGITRGFVNVGGDLVALGASEDGDPWRVGVRDPADPNRLLNTLEITDAAVATSGDSEQGFECGGRRYHHLLDPQTGAPRRSEHHSLTVVAERCLTADAAATTCFGLPTAAAERLLRTRAPDARIAS
jgi:thiamine biosynthesis lipoprotein